MKPRAIGPVDAKPWRHPLDRKPAAPRAEPPLTERDAVSLRYVAPDRGVDRMVDLPDRKAFPVKRERLPVPVKGQVLVVPLTRFGDTKSVPATVRDVWRFSGGRIELRMAHAGHEFTHVWRTGNDARPTKHTALAQPAGIVQIIRDGVPVKITPRGAINLRTGLTYNETLKVRGSVSDAESQGNR